MDIFLYSGPVERGYDLQFVDFISAEKKSDSLTLVLSTPGGSPDAAYKMGRYIQSKYEHFHLFVPGYCKSAGTLLAVAAEEIIFSRYGELGPLDVQMTKKDNLAGLESGLNISEAFLTLERQAKETFHNMVSEITGNSGGIISFHTASHSAAEIVSALFGPIFGRIDPEEVGSRARAMRIGADYAKRLNSKFGNLKGDRALTLLTESYSSHGFVIDMEEAMLLFSNVREAILDEKALVEKIGRDCRIPRDVPRMDNLTGAYNEIIAEKEASNVQSSDEPELSTGVRRGRKQPPVNGEDPEGASQPEGAQTG